MNDIERATYWWNRAREAEDVIDRLRKLHERGKANTVCTNADCPCGNYDTCLHCDEYSAKGVAWPCDTIKALDGVL